jgi:hypothetical protein
MNERIRELWRQAVLNNTKTPMNFQDAADEFAELIVRECAMVAWQHTPDTEELEYSHLIKDKILANFGVEE